MGSAGGQCDGNRDQGRKNLPSAASIAGIATLRFEKAACLPGFRHGMRFAE